MDLNYFYSSYKYYKESILSSFAPFTPISFENIFTFFINLFYIKDSNNSLRASAFCLFSLINYYFWKFNEKARKVTTHSNKIVSYSILLFLIALRISFKNINIALGQITPYSARYDKNLKVFLDLNASYYRIIWF